MRKFFRNCKGAVTVMVSLMLVPCLLVSGTAVDIARIYAAKSTVQDTNQLAANSALASYDALLQDLYGLYGMVQDDETDYTDLVNGYVDTALGTGKNGEVGTFHLFYGSKRSSEYAPVAGKHLENQEVLMRQIEEYSKFRAPAIVANLLLDNLDTFEKLQEDAKAIQRKMNVDDGVEDLHKRYKKIYELVVDLDQTKEYEEDVVMKDVTETGKKIKEEFQDLQSELDRYEDAKDDYDDAYDDYMAAEDEETASAARSRMKSAQSRMEKIRKEYETTIANIKKLSSELATDCEDYEEKLNDAIEKLDDLVKQAEKAEEIKADLRDDLEKLKQSINSGKCSNDLVNGLNTPQDGADKSVIEQYEHLLEYDVKAMADLMKEYNEPQIENTITIMKEAKLKDHVLLELKDTDLKAQYPLDGNGNHGAGGPAGAKAEWEPDEGKNGNGFEVFEDISEESKKFWKELDKIYGSENGKKADSDKLNNSVTKIFKRAQQLFKDMKFEPEGAEYLYNGANTASAGTGTDFGSKEDWSKKDKGKKELQGALDDDFMKTLSNAANDVGTKILMLVYGTEMFSDASTPGSGGEGGTPDEGYPVVNMAGIPLTTEVNYYFQSELEYLYNGDLSDAKANLRSVTGMVFLIRFVFNYVASFTIQPINSLVSNIKAALAWTGPISILAGETARLALAMGESALDIYRLRDGDKIAVYKKESDWKLSIQGLADAAMNELSDGDVEASMDVGIDFGDDSGTTLTYTDYIRLFLLFVPNHKLSERIANLIELNVTNYEEKINADEGMMANAELFDMSKAVTDIEVTTTVDLRMLFLSMPFAQQSSVGVVPPKTIAITMKDCRGY